MVRKLPPGTLGLVQSRNTCECDERPSANNSIPLFCSQGKGIDFSRPRFSDCGQRCRVSRGHRSQALFPRITVSVLICVLRSFSMRYIRRTVSRSATKHSRLFVFFTKAILALRTRPMTPLCGLPGRNRRKFRPRQRMQVHLQRKFHGN